MATDAMSTPFNETNQGYRLLSHIFAAQGIPMEDAVKYYAQLSLDVIATGGSKLARVLNHIADRTPEEEAETVSVAVGEEQWQSALNQAQVSLEQNGRNKLANFCTALSLQCLGRREEALCSLVDLISLDVVSLPLWLHVAQLADVTIFGPQNRYCVDETIRDEDVLRFRDRLARSAEDGDATRTIIMKELKHDLSLGFAAIIKLYREFSPDDKQLRLKRKVAASTVADMYIEIGDHQNALASRVTELFHCDTEHEVFDLLGRIGGLFVHWSKLDAAERCLKIANKEPGFGHELLRSLLRVTTMGRLYELRGEYSEAIRYFEFACEQIKANEHRATTDVLKHELRIVEANVYGTYGALLRKLRNIKLATRGLWAAAERFAEAGLDADESLMLQNLSLCYLHSNKLDKAKELLHRACSKAMDLGRLVSLLVMLGKAEIEVGRIRSARRTLSDVLELMTMTNCANSLTAVMVTSDLAFITNDETSSMRLFADAMRWAERCESEDARAYATVHVLIVKGKSFARRENVRDAIKCFEQAYAICENAQMVGDEMRTFWATGDPHTCSKWLQSLHSGSNSSDKEANPNEKALEWAENSRAQSLQIALREKFASTTSQRRSTCTADEMKSIAQRHKVYFLVLSSYEQNKSIAIWLVSSDMIRFSLVDDLDFFERVHADLDDNDAEVFGAIMSEAEAAESDDEEEFESEEATRGTQRDAITLLQSIVGRLNTNTSRFADYENSKQTAHKKETTSVAAALYTHTEEKDRGGPRFTPTEHLPTANARLYYRKLVKPFDDFADDYPIVVVANEELFTLPFAAFLGEEDDANRRLITKRQVVLSPSVQIYDLLASRVANEVETNRIRNNSNLVVGNPTIPTSVPQGKFGSWQLPFAEAEAVSVAKMLNTVPLTGDDATKVRVVEALRSTSTQVVHIATHADETFEDGHLSGALLFAPEKSLQPLQDCMLTSGEIQQFDLSHVRLAVLSCCSTGVGQRMKAEGVLGLARAFLFAGVPQVVASLWPISDSTTEMFMKDFYDFYALKSQGASQSYQQAMKLAIERGGTSNAWAGFYLLGTTN